LELGPLSLHLRYGVVTVAFANHIPQSNVNDIDPLFSHVKRACFELFHFLRSVLSFLEKTAQIICGSRWIGETAIDCLLADVWLTRQ
jgi:hypothetical protein